AGAAALGRRHGHQPAIQIEGPAVVEAGEAVGMTAALVDHLGTAMAAAVEQHADAAVTLAHHDDGLTPELGGVGVAGVGDLALMADIEPGPAEQTLHLELEDLRVGVDTPADAPDIDETLNCARWLESHVRSPSLPSLYTMTFKWRISFSENRYPLFRD